MDRRTSQYEQRFYRQWMHAQDLEEFSVRIRESDLMIMAERVQREQAFQALSSVRTHIEQYIGRHPAFGTSMQPVDVDPDASEPVRAMARAGERFGVGPMAAVAGVVAQRVGRALLERMDRVIVENGGDVFVRMDRPVTFGLYAGEQSPFHQRVCFRLDASAGLGVCTSSAVVGPSLSLGRADAVVAICPDAAMADAAATAYANRIHRPEDVDRVMQHVQREETLDGIIACMGDRIGFYGKIELATVSPPPGQEAQTGSQPRARRTR